MKVSVIVAAAGRGTRFGGKRNKIFERLGSQPVFIRSLELFVNRDDVCQTILVINPDDREIIKERYAANIGFMGVKLVDGGADPAGDACATPWPRWTSRPSWWPSTTPSGRASRPVDRRGFRRGRQGRGGHPGLPHPRHDEEGVGGHGRRRDRPRAGLWQAQTPQVFQRTIIQAAYAKAPADAEAVTDDAQLRRGYRPSGQRGDGRSAERQDHHPRRPGAGGGGHRLAAQAQTQTHPRTV